MDRGVGLIRPCTHEIRVELERGNCSALAIVKGSPLAGVEGSPLAEAGSRVEEAGVLLVEAGFLVGEAEFLLAEASWRLASEGWEEASRVAADWECQHSRTQAVLVFS